MRERGGEEGNDGGDGWTDESTRVRGSGRGRLGAAPANFSTQTARRKLSQTTNRRKTYRSRSQRRHCDPPRSHKLARTDCCRRRRRRCVVALAQESSWRIFACCGYAGDRCDTPSQARRLLRFVQRGQVGLLYEGAPPGTPHLKQAPRRASNYPSGGAATSGRRHRHTRARLRFRRYEIFATICSLRLVPERCRQLVVARSTAWAST
jgi:hypothetical protein